jgi:thiamine-phosphate diphosphorylase/hydroxyethylthiazole kinase
MHIGQTDTPLTLARSMLGPDAIIGLSVSTPAEAKWAEENGADYVGIGPVWATQSKDVSKKTIVGCDGVGAILDQISIDSVAIGE